MKRIYITICLMLVSAFGFSQWTAQTSGTSLELKSVFFTDLNTGYVVGNSGTIIKTSNGGTNWVIQTAVTSYSLNSVYFTDANTGVAVGNNGIILKTTNAGTFWVTKPSGTSYDLKTIQFVNSNIGFTCGGVMGSRVYYTGDGGNNWYEIGYLMETSSNSVFFTDENTGFWVYWANYQNKSQLRKTTNGGNNWSYVLESTNWLYSVYFKDFYNGFIVGDAGTILKTNNGGVDWNALTSGTTNCLYSIYFVDLNIGFAVGAAGTILKTTDGGLNWFTQASGTTNNLKSVFFTDANNGYVVGENGTILKTSNGGGSINQFQLSELAYSLFPNPSNNKITINNNGDLKKETVVNIFDIQGMLVLSNSFKYQNKMDFDVSSLAPGIYMVKIQTEQGFAVKRLVVQ